MDIGTMDRTDADEKKGILLPNPLFLCYNKADCGNQWGYSQKERCEDMRVVNRYGL